MTRPHWLEPPDVKRMENTAGANGGMGRHVAIKKEETQKIMYGEGPAGKWKCKTYLIRLERDLDPHLARHRLILVRS